MRPVLFDLPFGLPLYSYGLMLTVSVLVGRLLAIRLAERAGIDAKLADRCATWTLVGAIVGARLLFVVTNLDQFDHLLDIFAWWKGGVVAYGGFLGGLVAAIVFCRIHGFLCWRGPTACAPLCVGLAITRVGCFLGGCDFGREWNGPWAVRFPAGSPAFLQQTHLGLLPPGAVASLPVHPTQLYESLAGVVLLVLVVAVHRRQRVAGHALAAFALGYAVLRYLIEIVRADPGRGAVGPWSTSQFIAVATFVAAAVLLYVLRRNARRSPIPLTPCEENVVFMGDFLKSAGHWVRVGWFWPLALLTFPMCFLDSTGLPGNNDPPPDPPAAFDPGPSPVTSAIMCDIPKFNGSGCASDQEILDYPSKGAAAVALNLGEGLGQIVLDYSPNSCVARPMRVELLSPFPDGLIVCLNCGTQIPAVYGDATKACIAKCKELNSSGVEFPADDVDPFCEANAHVSTNFNIDTCYPDFCSMAGTPIPNTNDPRRDPENLTWVDFQPNDTIISAVGNTLSFAGPGTGDFSAGAASEQLITTGDAWVEFEAGETGVSHVVGVRASCDTIASCPDTDGTLADIPLSISLNVTGEVNVVENVAGASRWCGAVCGLRRGRAVPDPRRRPQRRHGGYLVHTAPRPLRAEPACTGTTLYSHPVGTGPPYPLRVDATFREADATLTNVTIVRIKSALGEC